jgi:arylsulfatase A-like enzyme
MSLCAPSRPCFLTGLYPHKTAPPRQLRLFTASRGRRATPAAKASRTERYKLILNLNPMDKEELYDLKIDPQEMQNLALDNNHRDTVLQLKRNLLFDMKQLEDPAVPAVEATMKRP